jgi:poly(beta-D-mannuronate) lyase
LTAEPPTYNREGTIKRSQYIVGLNVLALKFKTAGQPIDGAILIWLRTLNHKNMDWYQRGANRGNLYVWSGAAAALFAILDRDARALGYQDQAWRDAMAAIRDDGTVAGELARGHRALIYHMFSLSATLVLRSARKTLGIAESPADNARVKLLADQIGRALCDPHLLEVSAQVTQEIPGDWAYRAPLGFGREILSSDWSRCGKPNANLSDPTIGGDTQVSAEVLRQLSR